MNPDTEFKSRYWNKVLRGKRLARRPEEHFYDGTTYPETDLPWPYRVLSPGTVYTMDYDETRLNVVVDERRKIIQVYYG